MVGYRDAAAPVGILSPPGTTAGATTSPPTRDHSWCRHVKIVVSDGSSSSYKAAINAWLSHATDVLDRFHVVRVRHEAPCVRGRVRDLPCRAVAAVR